MKFTLLPEDEREYNTVGTRRDSMTQSVGKIRCSSWVLCDTDKMISTHAPVYHALVTVISADDLEIQRIEAQHDKPSEIPSI